MLHSPAIADPSQRKVVNSYPIGTLGVGACALQFANRAQTRMNLGFQQLTAMSKDGPRPTSIKSWMRPLQATGLLIR